MKDADIAAQVETWMQETPRWESWTSDWGVLGRQAIGPKDAEFTDHGGLTWKTLQSVTYSEHAVRALLTRLASERAALHQEKEELVGQLDGYFEQARRVTAERDTLRQQLAASREEHR